MWLVPGLLVIITIDSLSTFQLGCVLNYLSKEEDEVGVVIYLGEGSEDVRIFEYLVNEIRITWTVINRGADAKNIVGSPANYLIVANGSGQGKDPRNITLKALKRLSEFADFWEPAARMIILLGVPHVDNSSVYRDMASAIILDLWNLSAYNAMVMFFEDNLKGILRFYSANPFAEQNKCGTVVSKLIELSCFENYDAYPDEDQHIWNRPEYYPHCPLKVSRRESPPFSYRVGEDEWEGSDIRFVKLLSIWKNFDIVWSERPAPESGHTNEMVSRYYRNFTRNGIDLAVGGAVVNPQQLYKIEYLRPNTQLSLMYYVADEENLKGWGVLHTMFTGLVWSFLGLSLILGGITYSMVIEGAFNIKQTRFLLLLAILVCQTIDLPKKWRIRIFLVVFLFPLYHVSTLHSTALQSYMVHTPKEKPLLTETDLRNEHVPVFASDSAINLLKESRSHENIRLSHKPLRVRLRHLDSKKNFSVLARSLEVDFWRNLEHLHIHPIQPPITTFAVSLTMAKGSPYLDDVDDLAQRCLEVGFFEKWVTDLTRIKRTLPKEEIYYDSGVLEALDLEDLECAFLLLFVGLATSTGAFVGEIFIHKWQTLRQQERSIREKKRLKFYYVVYRKGLY